MQQGTQKLAAITRFFAQNDDRLSLTKWNKLLFFSDCVAINHPEMNRQILDGLKYIKMPFGPVLQHYDSHLKGLVESGYVNVVKTAGYQNGMLTFISSSETIPSTDVQLNEIEESIVKSVVTYFKTFSASEVSDFSHILRPWTEADMYDQLDLDLSKNETVLKQLANVDNLYRLVFPS